MATIKLALLGRRTVMLLSLLPNSQPHLATCMITFVFVHQKIFTNSVYNDFQDLDDNKKRFPSAGS